MRSFNEELLLVAKLISEADESLARGDQVSLRLGVITIDLAAETLLKASLGKLAAATNPESKFRELQKSLIEAGRAGAKDLVYLGQLGPLRNLRNTVQHDGTPPDRAAARKLATEAKGLLRQLSLDVFAVDVLDLGLADFVQTAEIKTALVAAGREIAAGSFGSATGIAVGCFESMTRRWIAYCQSLFGLKEGPEDLFGTIVGTVSAGIFLPDLKRFRDYARGAHYLRDPYSGEITPIVLGWDASLPVDEQKRRAQFCYEFAAGWTIRIEERLAQ